jgi:hypothetical protein
MPQDYVDAYLMCGHNDKPQKAQHSQSCGVLRIGPLFACMNGHGGSTSGRRRIAVENYIGIRFSNFWWCAETRTADFHGFMEGAIVSSSSTS